jgi:hypothetical protein
MEMRVPNTTHKASKVTFYYSAEPPALSVVNDDASEGFWFEIEDDYQLIALVENISHYLNRRYRLLYAEEQKRVAKS